MKETSPGVYAEPPPEREPHVVSYDPNAGYPTETTEPGLPAVPPSTPVRSATGGGQIFVTILLVALAFTGGWLGNSFVNGPAQIPPSARPYSSTIWDAWNIIDNNYADKTAIDHKKMTYAMIAAMVDSLGDTGHSRFLTPEDAKALTDSLSNSTFVGIGVKLQVVQTASGSINIIEYAIPGSPAAKAGMLPGDQIVKIDGKDVTTTAADDLPALIRGDKDTSVTVTVRRITEANPTGQLIDFKLTRDTVTSQVVVSTYFATTKIGFVQITGFDDGASKELHDTLTSLKSQGATSIILDLRGNGGGLVNEAVGVASDFLQSGQTVFVERDRTGATDKVKVDSQVDNNVPTGLHLDLPMVVLVDGGTASASEIVTGAIQDNRPDVEIIGQRTFGTDTELIPFGLPDGSQILLGIKQFLTPNLRQFKPGEGLTPTQVVALPANSFSISPLVLKQLGLNEEDVLACKGISVDTQLIAAIQTLAPDQKAVQCAA